MTVPIQLRDWVYIRKPNSRRGFYGFVFTIQPDGGVHVWDPKRYLGHRLISKGDEVTLVCRNVRLKRPGPDFIAMYSSDQLPWSAWQTLGTTR